MFEIFWIYQKIEGMLSKDEESRYGKSSENLGWIIRTHQNPPVVHGIKTSACSASVFNLFVGEIPREGNGDHQYTCLEIYVYTPWGCQESDVTGTTFIYSFTKTQEEGNVFFQTRSYT